MLQSKTTRLRKWVTLSLLGAIAFVLTAFIRIPVVMFLKFDPKDIVLALAGFIFGPLEAMLVTVVVALIEMITVSDTGIWGFVMNVISSVCFILPPALLYRRKRSLQSAVLGLVFGVIFMDTAMLAWNLLVTPIYMGYPRQAVAELLIPVFLPFNLLKGGINAVLTFLLYKPVSKALVQSKLIPQHEISGDKASRNIVSLIAFVILLILLSLGGIYILLQ